MRLSAQLVYPASQPCIYTSPSSAVPSNSSVRAGGGEGPQKSIRFSSSIVFSTDPVVPTSVARPRTRLEVLCVSLDASATQTIAASTSTTFSPSRLLEGANTPLPSPRLPRTPPSSREPRRGLAGATVEETWRGSERGQAWRGVKEGGKGRRRQRSAQRRREESA